MRPVHELRESTLRRLSRLIVEDALWHCDPQDYASWWSASRRGEEMVRIFSARRVTRQERRDYEENVQS